MSSIEEMGAEDRQTFEQILEVLHAQTGTDVREYRRATVVRRLKNRMLMANTPSLASYLERLQADPDEGRRLLERIAIKVSAFFRNGNTFEALENVLREHVQCRPSELSIWSAGCAYGQEPFSLAILLDELNVSPDGVRILATDLDEAAIARARRGLYSEAELDGVSAERRERYFSPLRPAPSAGFELEERIRRRVSFCSHDLGTGTPPADARFDLICCRNTLIYFQASLRSRVVNLFRRALVPGGLLCLGEAEWLTPELGEDFVMYSASARMFQKRRD